jgi:PAS domain-containing protein
MSAAPVVFVGSSGRGLSIAYAVQEQLENARVQIWKDGVFQLGHGNLENLVNAASRFDFAILVITADDVVTRDGVQYYSPRDNVLFELGLFIGRLGPDRTFILCSKDPAVRLPSDLSGVTVSLFTDYSDLSLLQTEVSRACNRIRNALAGFKPAQQWEQISLKMVVDQSDIPMYLTDSDYVVRRCNEAMVRMIGAEKSRILGQPLLEVTRLAAQRMKDGDSFLAAQARVFELAQRSAAPHPVFVSEVTFVDDSSGAHPNGHGRLWIHADRLYSEENRPLGTFVVAYFEPLR